MSIDTTALPPSPPDPEPLRRGETWTGFDEHAPRRQPRGPLGPCARCRAGDHDACTKVGCYRCDTPHQTHGLFGGSNGLQGGSRR